MLMGPQVIAAIAVAAVYVLSLSLFLFRASACDVDVDVEIRKVYINIRAPIHWLPKDPTDAASSRVYVISISFVVIARISFYVVT